MAKKSNVCMEGLSKFSEGASYLHSVDSSLHTTTYVEKSVEEVKGKVKPVDKLKLWLSNLEEEVFSLAPADRLKKISAFKKLYKSKYVIDAEDIPESYFQSTVQRARRRGLGNIQLSETEKTKMINLIRNNQIESLNNWLDFILSEESDLLPGWVRHWALEGILAIGNLNLKKGDYSKRRASTLAPFVDINKEAFERVVKNVIKVANGESLDGIKDIKFKALLKAKASFGRLYAQKIKYMREVKLLVTKGKWTKFKRGSNPEDLMNTLKGKESGWCTLSKCYATDHLEKGDFYIYFSEDTSGKAVNPRIAIRMKEDSIREVRGIAADQNLDEHILKTDILDNKLSKFGREGRLYIKRVKHMSLLTEIESKVYNSKELSESELRFLYEIDEKIQGFGFERDPRIDEILNTRDMKKDISLLTGLKEDEISLNAEEALLPGKMYHHGDLDFKRLKHNPLGLSLPNKVTGNLILSSYESALGLKLPEYVGGNLDLNYLKSVEELILPRVIQGNLFLQFLKIKESEGLDLSDTIIKGKAFLVTLGSLDEVYISSEMDPSKVITGAKVLQKD